MSIKRKLAASLVGLVFGLSSLEAIAAEKLRVSNWLPATEPLVIDVIQVWADKVKEVTQGRVEVEIIPALGKPDAHFDLVKNGVADVAMGVDGYTADRFVLPYAFKLPFVANSSTAASLAYWRTYKSHLEKHNEFAGVHLLGLWAHGPGLALTTKRQLASMDDFRGLKLRVTGGAVQDIAAALGATPQFAPVSQTYELLTRGVVDGAMLPLSAAVGFKVDTALTQGFNVPGGLFRDTHYLIMNEARYKSLSAEDQKAIDGISGEVLARLAGASFDRGDKAAAEKMNAAGFKSVTASGAFLDEVKARLMPLQEAWIARVGQKGIDGKAILSAFADEVKKAEAEAK